MSRVRAARVAADLSQAELATAAGVSRQAVGAIEAGRHRPSVDAALAIAAAVGGSVETLFATGQATVPVFGEPLEDGAAVLAARVGDRVVYAPAQAAFATEGWALANARLRDDAVLPLPGADLDGFVAMGCDPALGSAAAQLGRRFIALSGSSATAVSALRAGRVHAALVHDRRLPRPPSGVARIHFARWRVGIATRRPRSLDDLRAAAIVQREPGAATQKALLRAFGDAPRGPVAADHLDVARRVAAGATAGVTMEPAALRHGLAFAALEEHAAQLWVDERWQDHPGLQAFLDAVRSRAFLSRMGLIEGYELAGCGDTA